MDILEDKIEIAKKIPENKNVKFIDYSLFDERVDDYKVDCIVFLEVIEHIDNPGEFLQRFKKILNKGGLIVISTPNVINTVYFYNYLFSSFDKWYKNIIDTPLGSGTSHDHVAGYTFDTLIRLFYSNGYKMIDPEFK